MANSRLEVEEALGWTSAEKDRRPTISVQLFGKEWKMWAGIGDCSPGLDDELDVIAALDGAVVPAQRKEWRKTWEESQASIDDVISFLRSLTEIASGFKFEAFARLGSWMYEPATIIETKGLLLASGGKPLSRHSLGEYAAIVWSRLLGQAGSFMNPMEYRENIVGLIMEGKMPTSRDRAASGDISNIEWVEEEIDGRIQRVPKAMSQAIRGEPGPAAPPPPSSVPAAALAQLQAFRNAVESGEQPPVQ